MISIVTLAVLSDGVIDFVSVNLPYDQDSSLSDSLFEIIYIQ